MVTLLASLVLLGSLIALHRMPAPTKPPDRATWLRYGLIGLILVLPLVVCLAILASAGDRLHGVVVESIGKRVAFSERSPLVAGSSSDDRIEDLRASGIGERSLEIVPAPRSGPPEATQDEAPPAAWIRLRSPGPAVGIDGELLNRIALQDGDEILVRRSDGTEAALHYRGGAIHREGKKHRLQGRLARMFAGGMRVYELERLGAALGASIPGEYSFVFRPSVWGPWSLVLRSDRVRLRRGEALLEFVEEHPVPASFELTLSLVPNRSLRTQRRDRVFVLPDQIEVRYADVGTWVVPLDRDEATKSFAITVPATHSNLEMIELPEGSSRFRGLSATYERDASTGQSSLTYAGDRQDVEPGAIYALGSGRDRLLVRLDEQRYPRQLPFDLALLALFLAVFLGRGFVANVGLLAIVGPVGLLLCHRLLFSYRASIRPPDYAVEPFQEARLALWLVPALILFAWTLAFALRRRRRSPRLRDELAVVAWPLTGLVTAAMGCYVVTRGWGEGIRSLWLAPIGLALSIVAVVAASWALPRAAALRERLQEAGVPWSLRALLIAGVSILVVRAVTAQIGMAETLRIPVIEFRVLWTVLQLPLIAACIGWTLHRLSTPSSSVEADGARRPGPHRRWILGVLAVFVFLILVFPLAGAAARDFGLVLAHSLAPLFALLVLVPVPTLFHGLRHWQRRVLCALPALPLLAVLLVNVYPEILIRWVGWDVTADTEESWMSASQLGSSRSQQLFRVMMLANPSLLQDTPVIASERVSIQHATLQRYADQAREGGGFLSSELPSHLSTTYLSDLVPMVFVLPELGKAGLVGLALIYLTLLLSVVFVAYGLRGDRETVGQQGLFVALVALLAVVLPSLYMMLANLNLVLFTGKNMSLLSLNSISDVLQGGGLLGLAVICLGLRRGVT